MAGDHRRDPCRVYLARHRARPKRLEQVRTLLSARARRQDDSEPARRATLEGLRHGHTSEPLRNRNRRPRGRRHQRRRRTGRRPVADPATEVRAARARIPLLRGAVGLASACRRRLACERARDASAGIGAAGVGGDLGRLHAPRRRLWAVRRAQPEDRREPRRPARRHRQSELHGVASTRNGTVDRRQPALALGLRRAARARPRATSARDPDDEDHTARIRDALARDPRGRAARSAQRHGRALEPAGGARHGGRPGSHRGGLPHSRTAARRARKHRGRSAHGAADAQRSAG